LQEVTLQLRWYHQFQFAGYYAAKAKGFYRDVGLDVTILERDAQQDPVTLVATRQADFGVTNAEVLLHALHGEPLVVLAAIFQHSPLVLVAREETGITTPHDLTGRRVKMTRHSRDVELHAMLLNEGISLEQLDLTDGEVGVEDYRNPAIDALSGYVTNEPYYLEREGMGYHVIWPRKYGIDFYGDCLFTSESMIAERPELVRAFLAASLKGWTYAMAHSEEIIDLILAEYGSNKTREHLQFEAAMLRELILPDLVEMGHMNPGRWRHIGETFARLHLVGADSLTEEFLEAFIHDPRKDTGAVTLRRWLWALSAALFVGGAVTVLLLWFLRQQARHLAERKRSEEKLRESEERFRLAFLTSPDSININRLADGMYRDINEGFTKIMGYTPEEAIGRTSLELNIWKSQEDRQRLVQGLQASGYVENLEARFVGKDGKVRTGLMSARILELHGEKVILSVTRDITERKQAEEALHRANVRLNEAQRIGGIGDWAWDPATNTVSWSENLYIILGLDPGQPPPDYEGQLALYHPEDAPKLHEAVTRALLDGEAYELEMGSTKPDGGEIKVLVRGVPQVDEEGRVIGLFGSVLDVTERKQAEEALVAAKLEAEAASRAKSVFLANMSHEIRTPLNGIMGMLQILKQAPLMPEQRDYVETALQSSRRLARLLSDILDISRVEAGRLEVEKEPFDLRDVFDCLLQLFSPVALQKGLAFNCHLDPAIPARLSGDAARLQQVLSNLVGNAIKFTRSGQVDLEAFLLATSDSEQYRVLFSVADTGIGIPDDHLEHLFDAFTQGESSYRRQYQGAGLGLAISKGLVSLMGGNMSVVSKLGAGTTFFVCIPFQSTASIPKIESTEERPVRGGLRVLLADDDEVTRFSASRLVEIAGHKVRAVENGELALQALRDDHYDLVLMDIQMPVMDGVEATRAIRQGMGGNNSTTIPIVAMTAYAMLGDRERFLDAGMDDYIAKPVEVEELNKVLERLAFHPEIRK
jgi:PAS domain S-box-containing protein